MVLKYLVTGGAGFIGSNFISFMLNKYSDKISIINVDKLTYAGNLENLEDVKDNPNYQFIQADICDVKAIEDIFEHNEIDYVINFAAESHVDRSIMDSSVFIMTNVVGTQVLLEAARKQWTDKNGKFKKGKKFLQVSTDEVYGSLGSDGLFTEKTPLDPHSPYSASKAAADLIVKAYFDTHKMPINITRCSNNYGPYQCPEKLIPLVINNCLNGKSIPVYGDGKNVRDWLYVDDHCEAIDRVLQDGILGEVYNIGGNNEKENIQIVKLIINGLYDLLDPKDPRREGINEDLITFVEDRKGHDRRYAIDATKMKTELAWEPKRTFEEAIVTTMKWYLSNSRWLMDATSDDYQLYYQEMYNKNNQD